MSSFRCPFCHVTVPSVLSTEKERYLSFRASSDRNTFDEEESVLKLTIRRCPECNFEMALVVGISGMFAAVDNMIFPKSSAKQFPEYVPEAIRNDYEEAYAILNLSPKAAATLARRCLQGIIRDFFGVSCKTLNQEIDSIKTLVSPSLWNAMNSLRSIGNIGAHMEKDVNIIVDIEPNESEKLLSLIERIIESTYVQRQQDEALFAEINYIATEKNNAKSGVRSSI